VIQQQQQQQTNTAEDLARVPLEGSGGATHHVLQTVVIQQRNLQRQYEELQVQIHQMDQSNRVWMENKFRGLNNNIRRFGGTIQGGFTIQGNANTNRQQVQRPPELPNHPRGGRIWPKLSPNIKDLRVLWAEYEHGISGRKPARAWTREERGGGGDTKVKQTFYRRNNIWKIQKLLINKGYTVHSANALIEETYGASSSITSISKAIVQDRKQHRAHGGLHPKFR